MFIKPGLKALNEGLSQTRVIIHYIHRLFILYSILIHFAVQEGRQLCDECVKIHPSFILRFLGLKHVSSLLESLKVKG